MLCLPRNRELKTGICGKQFKVPASGMRGRQNFLIFLDQRASYRPQWQIHLEDNCVQYNEHLTRVTSSTGKRKRFEQKTKLSNILEYMREFPEKSPERAEGRLKRNTFQQTDSDNLVIKGNVASF